MRHIKNQQLNETHYFPSIGCSIFIISCFKVRFFLLLWHKVHSLSFSVCGSFCLLNLSLCVSASVSLKTETNLHWKGKYKKKPQQNNNNKKPYMDFSFPVFVLLYWPTLFCLFHLRLLQLSFIGYSQKVSILVMYFTISSSLWLGWVTGYC